ncbi:efflux RND transporter periplasmic adaptor subunit [Luteolibacter sp. LG18]|uniref:efflux RND transporter periplasmic adaptor subunit n=1 Tax=Luteolibacter sp. LG18 TaxID=2819286 RepID=UPI002B280E7D|nr:secretion protein HlyD [Luteolibacter sp. LG18]
MKRFLPLPLVIACTAPALADKVEVKVITPKPATQPRAFEVPARTEPAETATIFSRATGVIHERKVDIGDRVAAGDVLATIDAPEIARQIEAAQATIDQAEAKAKVARTVATRSEGLLKEKAVSKEATEQSTATAEELDASVRAYRAELGKLQELQKFMTIRAPFDATITARKIDRGDHVNGDPSSADAWLFQLYRINELRVVVQAPPDLALRLETGTEGKVSFPELPGKKFTAKVARTSRSIETVSGTMRAELLLKNDDRALPSGLSGTVTFDLAPAPGTFLVPTNTLIVRAGKASVATVVDGKVKLVEVGQGRNLGESVEVTSAGLTGQPVIVSPNALIREGDEVNAVPLPPKK